MRSRTTKFLILATAVLLSGARLSYGQDGPSPAELKVTMDTLWVMLAAFLVFFMNAGFALVESGFCRSKNTVNIMAKNFIVFAISTLAFWAVGFALMFGDGNAVFGVKGFLLLGADNSPATGNAYSGVFSALNWTGVPLEAKFFFQLVFAGAAATIVSGAVAERIRFGSFILFSFILVALVYSVAGHWVWGGGFLADKFGFLDFAGSTVVHSVGGWAALTGIIVLGPRLGKYKKDGSVRPMPGHSMALATLGGLVLWLGWFGFNPGSTMEAGPDIAHIALTTNLAAAAGIVSATAAAWLSLGKPDLSMIINGALAGLVAITAPCAYVGAASAAIIGAIAGVLVVYAVMFFDKLLIDDPVGATSVHLVNGVWGTLALGLFAHNKFGGGGDGLFFGGGIGLLKGQLTGVVAVGAFTVATTFIAWKVIDIVMGVRVPVEEEMVGLDLGEMGMEAYPGDSVAGWDAEHLMDEMNRKGSKKAKDETEEK